MASAKTDRKKERVKLYKKVRNTSSWRSIIIYFLMMVLYIAAVVFLAGFVAEYIFESKFSEGYNEVERTAKLYESGSDDKSIMDYIKSLDADFIVVDDSGKTLFEQGKITRSDEGGEISLSNKTENFMIYQDTELPLLQHNSWSTHRQEPPSL